MSKVSDFYKAAKSYVIGNKEEVMQSPQRIDITTMKDCDNAYNQCHIKNELPILLEVALALGITSSGFNIPSHAGVIPSLGIDALIAADVYSRMKALPVLGSTGYGLIGRVRDAFSILTHKKEHRNPSQV